MLGDLFDRGGDDGESEPEDAAPDGGATLFDAGDEGLNALDDLEGLGDKSADVFGGMDGDGADDTQELEQRIDEIENELAGMSSSVNTIKRENEEISGSVEEIEDNVRKLLDIYEMVTRGVNPFVDDPEPADRPSGGGSFGVFQNGSNDDESDDESIDESLSEADAESFFEDDIDDGDEEPPDEEQPTVSQTDSAGNISGADDGGTSFEELKAEYEAGTAEWAEDETTSAEASGSGDDRPASAKDADPAEDVTDGDPEPPSPEDGTGDPGGNLSTTVSMGSEPVKPTTDVDDESPSRDEVHDSEVRFVEDTLAGSARGSAKPYLDHVPDGYIGDVLVMEWLRYLVEASDPVDARRALEYYVAIEWIDAATADSLIAFLRGFGSVDDGDEEDTEADERPVGPRSLTMRHHTQSLRYICHLASDTPASIVLRGGSMPPPDGGGFEAGDR